MILQRQKNILGTIFFGKQIPKYFFPKNIFAKDFCAPKSFRGGGSVFLELGGGSKEGGPTDPHL